MRLFTLVLLVGACSFTARTAQQSGDAAIRDTASGGMEGLPLTCTPNETACDGRVRKVCGSSGMWDPTLDTVCDFTCSAGSCVVASNIAISDVAMCGSNAAVLAPPPGATVTMATDGTTHLECSPDCGGGVTRIDRTNVITNVQPNVAWFCLSQLSLAAGVTMTADPAIPATSALVFVVDGPVTIAGTLALDGAAATSAVPGAKGGPGGFAGADLTSSNNSDGHGPCAGKGGDHSGSSDHWAGGGGGGGGNATAGAGGGNGRCKNGDHTGNGRGASNASCSVASLIPLVGGSGGGAGGDATINVQQGWAGGGGGGAIEIASRVSITITGALTARGGAGYGENSVDGGGGGGAGGSLLLEAPALSLPGLLVVDGGAGGSAGAGPGGTGATGMTGAASGVTFAANGQGGRGGGGGAGRIRLNGNSACPSTVSPAGACTSGGLVPQ